VEDPETSERIGVRKEYGKALREQFAARMKQQLPQFQPVTVKHPSSTKYAWWTGERVFRWIAKDSVHCFIILVPTPKGADEFTVEVGWSTLGRYPELTQRPGDVPTLEREEFGKPEFTCRLSWLIPGLADWWSARNRGRCMAIQFQEKRSVLPIDSFPIPRR
jgi:hypothetical protein